MAELALTRRQQAVLDYLKERESCGESAPTLDELCDAMGLRSRGSLHKHVIALVDCGLVEAMGRKQRGVRLTNTATDISNNVVHIEKASLSSRSLLGSSDPAVSDAGPVARMAMSDNELPLLGTIAAGRPIEAISGNETVEVPGALRTHRPCYVLRVQGDSMMEDGILDGDLVVVEQRDSAQNGEIVVALIDDEEATLKRLLQRPGEVILCPANSQMEAMHFSPDRVRIQGVVVGQMRQYQ
jgi:repressor LexA